MRVAITGMGCISPLGADCEAGAGSLRDSRDCITPVTAFDVSACKCKSAGQVSDEWLDGTAQITPSARLWNRASQMMLLATAEALGGREDFQPDAAIIATTSGGMSSGETFYRMCKQGGAQRRRGAQWRAAHLVHEYVPQQPARNALDAFGFDVPVRIVSNACASGTNALGMAFQLVRSGQAQRVICGGYDALCQLVFAGFSSLQAVTGELCRPFDAGRSGLVLGEGAAVFLLEPLGKTDRPVLAEITGYGTSSDNHHLTQPNPDGSGPRLSMQRAIADAHWSNAEIDYVNAHGTATAFNDACEARALGEVCPRAAMSSTKGQMGHSLGAAGAIEAAFCVMALQGGFLPANINFRSPDPAAAALDIIANTARTAAPRRALSNSLGFGGANATLAIEAAPR
ncbi:MAG: beta-ketoacyl-[acyl-carrier-protein] synthase family protein [Chthoniobacterales bacterium]